MFDFDSIYSEMGESCLGCMADGPSGCETHNGSMEEEVEEEDWTPNSLWNF